MKKKILSFLMSSILFVGIGFTQNAYAEWKLNSTGWTYLENGTSKTGWFLNGPNWYYLDNSGIMKEGWILDKGIYYYLTQSGALDNSKTTTTMPNEIKSVYDMVNSLVKDDNLKYVGTYFTIDGDSFSREGMEETNMYEFLVSDQYDIPIAEYYYNPQSGKVYKLVQGQIDNLGSPNAIYDTTKKITKDIAIQNVNEYLLENKISIPNLIMDSIDEYGNAFVVICYSKNVDHVNTVSRYYVDKTTGNVINAINE